MLLTEVRRGGVTVEGGSVRCATTGGARCTDCGGTPVVQARAATDLVGVPGRGGCVEVDFWSGHREWG